MDGINLNIMIKYYLGSYYLISGGNKIHFSFPPEEKREYFIHQKYDDYIPIKYNSNIVELNGIVVGFNGEIE